MTDAEFNKHKARIRRFMDAWFPTLINDAAAELHYAREGFDSRRGGAKVIADCEAKWEYHRASITFNMAAVSEASDKDLEETVVHEICHYMVNPMRDYDRGEKALATKIEEHTVHMIASAILETRDRAPQVKATKKKETRKR